MNKILASYVTLPELIDGKVCIVYIDGDDVTYSFHKPSKDTLIADNFDPMQYSVLGKKYNYCIIYSTRFERNDFLVRSRIKKLLSSESIPVYRVGDKIHIHSRQGTYELVEIRENSLVISCKKWRTMPGRNNHEILKSDFKCLAGGLNNMVYE